MNQGSQMGQLMNNPQYQQMMNAILNNPEALNQFLNSPEMRPLVEQNPQIRQVFQDPQARQLIFNQQFLQRMRVGQGGGTNQFAGGSENTSDFVNLAPSQEPNTRLGDLFSQWMNEHRNRRSSSNNRHSQTQSLPREEQSRAQLVFQQSDSNVDYKEKYKEQIAQIKEMGVDDEEKIIEVLKKCDGNVEYALNRLFG